MKKKVYAAMLLATTIVLSSSFTVCAESVFYMDGKAHTVEGDVEGDKSTAVAAARENTSVTVTGNVTQSAEKSNSIDGVGSYADAKVDVMGNVTVVGDGNNDDSHGVNVGNATANIDGDVNVIAHSGTADGLNSYDYFGDSSITVGGDVNTTAESEGAWGVYTNGSDKYSNSVKVGGDVFTEGEDVWGVELGAGNSCVTIEGDVVAIDTGLNKDGNESAAIEYATGVLYVGGNVDAYNATGISIGKNENAKGVINIEGSLIVDDNQFAIGVDTTDTKAPDINVSEIDANQYVGVWSKEENKYVKASDELTEDIMLNKVYYIVNVEDANNGNTDVDGTYWDGTANEGDALTIRVVADDGYEVTGVEGGKATVTRNDDGTYTIIVPRGGGVNIKAIMAAIIRQNSEASNTTEPEIKVEASKYPQVVNAATKSLGVADANGNVLIDLGEFTTINRALVQAMASRADVSYTLRYKYKGQIYQMVIPAGSDLSTYLDANGFCGVLYLGTVYPAVAVTK